MTKFSNKKTNKAHSVDDLTEKFQNMVYVNQTGSPLRVKQRPTDVLTHDRNRKAAREQARVQADKQRGLVQNLNEPKKLLFE